MKVLLSFLFFIPALSFANKADPINCPPEANTADKIIGKLQGNECESDTLSISRLTNSEYENFYGKLPQVKQKVKNVLLSGSKKELDLANQMLGAKPPKEWKEAAKNCNTILCALGKILTSEEAAKQAFNIYAKSGYVVSLDQAINGGLAEQIWSPKEVVELDAAVSKLPTPLKRLSRLKNIYRQADGLRVKGDHANVAAYARPGVLSIPGEIVIYDNGMASLSTTKNPYHSSAFTQEAIIHEICHHHDFQNLYATNYTSDHSSNKKNGWMKISAWKKTYDRQGNDHWSHDTNASFTRDYAATSPAEDYAETCMNYILHPDRLKIISPEKYTYMKNNLFKGEEFLDKTWNEERKYSWPEVDLLIADESFCQDALKECLNYFRSYDGVQGCIPSSIKKEDKMTTITSNCGKGNSILRNSYCLNNLKLSKFTDINQKFSQDPRYCEAGGPTYIQTKIDNICSRTTEDTGKILDQIASLEFGNQAQICEDNKDFTKECVYQEALRPVTYPKYIEEGIVKFLAEKVPDRIEPLSKHIDSTPSSVWLHGCFKGIKGIYKTKADTLAYSNFRDDSIYPILDQKKNSSLIDCAFGAVDSFKALGFKTPTKGIIENMMTETFKKELSSFESEVISAYPEAAKPCIADFCRVDILRKLLKKWEDQEPVKRKGFSDKKIVDELFPKIKNF